MNRFLMMMGGALMLLCLVPSSPARAQTTSVSDVLSRMGAILVEVDSLKREFETLKNQVSASPTEPAGSVLGASKVRLTLPLDIGVTNSDIEKVQRLLATDPEIYPDGIVSGFYGPKTVEAIRNLQGRFGLDQVGVIGPQTKALLESFLSAYPDEQYPADVLKHRPQGQVLGASTSVPSASPTPATPATNPLRAVIVEFDDDTAAVEIRYRTGEVLVTTLELETENDVIASIADLLRLSEAQVEAVSSFETSDDNEDENDDEADEVEDRLDEIGDLLDEVQDEIEDAQDDGDDTDEAEELYEEAEDHFDEAEEAYDQEDYDDALEELDDAEDALEEALDELGVDRDDDDSDLDQIRAFVTEGGTRIKVDYEDGDEDSFEIDADEKDEIIAEVSDELGVDESEVEVVMEFHYPDIDEISASISGSRSLVTVKFEDGLTTQFILNETDEDEIIEFVASELDLDEDEVEDLIDFD